MLQLQNGLITFPASIRCYSYRYPLSAHGPAHAGEPLSTRIFWNTPSACGSQAQFCGLFSIFVGSSPKLKLILLLYTVFLP